MRFINGDIIILTDNIAPPTQRVYTRVDSGGYYGVWSGPEMKMGIRDEVMENMARASVVPAILISQDYNNATRSIAVICDEDWYTEVKRDKETSTFTVKVVD